MGIVAVVDALITASSIQVQVELLEPHIWQYNEIWCAAYPDPVNAMDDPSASVYNVHMPATNSSLHLMPPIHFDTSGVPLTSDQTYWVKCRADESFNGGAYHYYLHTIVTTHSPLEECHTGVHWISNDEVNAHLYVQGSIQNGAVDLGHTRYYNFPSGIRGLNVFDVPRPLPASTTLEMTCCKGRECDFWVTMYICPECTGPRENGLVTSLLTNGWRSGSCSPKFDDNRYTVSFHKHINANTDTVVETIHSAHKEIVVVFGLEGRVATNWCSKARGPYLAPGGSCFRNGNCPAPFKGSNPPEVE